MSKSSADFLARQNVLPPILPPVPLVSSCDLLSHQRPIKPALGLLPPDRPDRVYTVKNEERLPIPCSSSPPC